MERLGPSREVTTAGSGVESALETGRRARGMERRAANGERCASGGVRSHMERHHRERTCCEFRGRRPMEVSIARRSPGCGGLRPMVRAAFPAELAAAIAAFAFGN